MTVALVTPALLLGGKAATGSDADSSRDSHGNVLEFGESIALPPASTTVHCVKSSDCSLNGACLLNGTCKCDAPWHGLTCGLLGFEATPPGGAYGYGSPFAVTSWGGNSIKHNGTWHGYFTEIGGARCGLGEWTRQSTVVHGISWTGPLGPYEKKSIVLAHEAHNPQVLYFDGAWYIFHIGSADSTKPLHACDNLVAGIGSLASAPAPVSHIHRSVDPYGPFLPLAVETYPECNNPGPFLHQNGTLYLVCTWSLHSAPRPEGPWMHVVDLKPPSSDKRRWEDPYLFINQRGFHILAHTYTMLPYPSIATSGLAFSENGLNWTFNDVEPYPSSVIRTSGALEHFATMERPKFLFADATAPERPTHLINGVSPYWNSSDPDDPCAACGHCSACKCHKGIDWTYTLARTLKL